MDSKDKNIPYRANSRPDLWETKPLESITEYITEKIPISSIDSMKYISTENMISYKGGITAPETLPKNIKITKFLRGDILLSNIRPYFKKIWFAKFEGGCSQDVLVIRAKDGVMPWFLYYYLTQDSFFEYTVRSSKGTKMPRGDKNAIMSFPVNVPSPVEQKAISKILSDLDSKIELNQKMNKTLESIAQAIFKHWFIDFEFPNEEGKPYKSSGGDMVDSELGKIPMGWEVKRIRDLCISIENGGTPKRMEKKYWNGTINWFKTGELNDRPLIDSAEKITREGLMNSSCKLWKINTILIALYASPTVGRLGLLKVEGASNQACSGLVAKDEIGYSYLFYTLFFKRDELNNIATGAAQQNISQEIIKESVCIQPPLKLLDNFNWMVSRLIDRQTLLSKEQATLSNIRDSILPKLLTGKIRVPWEG